MKRYLPLLILFFTFATFGAGWEYERTEDKMRGGVTHTAILRSNNSVRLKFPYEGDTYLNLEVRDSVQYGKDIIVFPDRGQVPCILGCKIHAKFDLGKVQTISANGPEASSSDAVFVSGYSNFISQLKQAKKLVLEVSFYDRGPVQFDFDVEKLVWPPAKK